MARLRSVQSVILSPGIPKPEWMNAYVDFEYLLVPCEYAPKENVETTSNQYIRSLSIYNEEYVTLIGTQHATKMNESLSHRTGRESSMANSKYEHGKRRIWVDIKSMVLTQIDIKRYCYFIYFHLHFYVYLIRTWFHLFPRRPHKEITYKLLPLFSKLSVYLPIRSLYWSYIDARTNTWHTSIEYPLVFITS